ncbi:Acyl-CoA dehydrogenase [Polystyrenella longa]|uniref:Acyl-CoA dehydrogenase n=1 Tax=Polystyrenella longa TaxID=2528007 RepID=A0A518CLH4_9PLAN|nr:acyl-CoA dehydrogenase family protein [Polystyrenella longa]QDU80090.1 Acyl-CoA dehydrogenase [Polystyrenella longa]
MSPETSEEKETFVETALKLGGSSEDEARKTGALDRADEQMENLFNKKYQTSGSPVHLAVWGDRFPTELFNSQVATADADAQQVMEDCITVVKELKREGRLLDENHKISEETLHQLAEKGYWGLLVDKEYGGSFVPFSAFSIFLTRMATVDATVAGMASVHGCIGAVDPLRGFGTPKQKQKLLPVLASGERLSAFALTEPCAGSDLTALRTTAKLDGDEYVVNGEKLFITNVVPGRTIGLVCLIENKPAVLIVELPPEENEHFQIKPYGLWALKHTYNQGIIFKNFRVPEENLLVAPKGDGLTIAYHGLNRGRIALCAGAAGSIRLMLADMLPWAQHRVTYGAAIETRELVQRRLGRMAGLIAGCDALTEWGGWLLDQGFRGEMECIVAKIFGSEAQKEAAIEYYMKTHGGRSFLHGHLFGDNVHEFLAPCIYEGEGEVLGLAFLKSLIKEHGKQFFEPIGKVLYENKIKSPNPLNPMHAFKLAPVAGPYLAWKTRQSLPGAFKQADLPAMPPRLAELTRFAAKGLQRSRLECSNMMMKHKLSLPNRQCAMSEVSSRIQKLIVMFATCMWAAKQKDELVVEAAIVLGQDLRRELTGARVSNEELRTVTKLGAAIAEGKYSPIADIDTNPILMNYEND